MSTQHTAHSTQQKLADVTRILRGFERVIIAFSGGVDSTLLAKLAQDVLGSDNVLAVTADSPSLAREDLAAAKRLAEELGLKHEVVVTQEVADPRYRANTPGRCYVCKQELFTELEALARARAIPAILYGAIGDDEPSERPGQRAAAERGVRAPLQEAGFEKWEVREAAKALGLSNWDKPQNACLASRVPHGHEVTEEKLGQIERAESFLCAQGFRQVRVRHVGDGARIEVEPEAVCRFDDEGLRRATEAVLRALGFASVTVDPRGYRAGGANE